MQKTRLLFEKEVKEEEEEGEENEEEAESVPDSTLFASVNSQQNGSTRRVLPMP